MKIDREALVKKAQALKGKSKKARGEKKREVSLAFRQGARKLARKLKKIPKPAPKAEEAAPAS